MNECSKTELRASGTVELVAAKAEGGDKPSKAMHIVAYNGGLMNVGWGYPTGIELSGLKWRDDNAVPILCLHDSHSLDAICGQADAVRVEGKSLVIDAQFMPISEQAKKVHELAKCGYRFQASVGVSSTDTLVVCEGETAVLNGEAVEGPCYIVRAGSLNEVSIVPLGADGTTNTAIAAAHHTQKEDEMSEMKKTVEAEKPATNTVEAAQVERDRVASVIKACGTHADIMAKAVEAGWTAEKAELECLRAEKAEAASKHEKIEAERPSAPAIIDLKAAAPRDAKTVVAAICMGAAMSDGDVEKLNKGVDLDAAKDLGVTRLSDVFAAFGFDYRAGDISATSKALKAAFSTVDIPNVLSNAVNKFVLRGFGAVGEDWRQVSRAIAVNDFKAVKGVRLLMGGVLQPLAKGGELKHVELSDEARELAAATKGSMVGITREDLINDDLAVLATIPERFGQMAGRTINRDTFGVVAALQSGDFGAHTTGALNLDNLAAAYALAMEIKDGNGDPLAAMPTKILCAPGSYVKARGIYTSEQITGASAKDVRENVMRGLLAPITTPYLSGTAYYLFNEAFPLVDVAFLNGRQTPVVETAEADFNQLGIQMRCYFDYGCAAGETKAALVSTGA